MKEELVIGSHVSMKGDEMFLGSVKEAISYNANSFMIYTGAPQNTRRKEIAKLRIEEGLELMKKGGIDPKNIVVHAPYIMNLANPDPEKRRFAIEFLTEEIVRSHAMKATQIVLHPGSAVGKDRPQAIKWIAEGLNQVISNTEKEPVRIALETMAGKGNEIGYQFFEIGEIISLIDKKNRVSVCLDTCHIYDAGYDIKNDLKGVLKKFDAEIGLDKISVIHINDSKNPFHSRKDRHENIGKGSIGLEALMKIINQDRFKEIPKILETPYIDGQPPYKEEIQIIRELTSNVK